MTQHTIVRHGADAKPIKVIAYAASNAKAVIINCPGYNGDTLGFNNKYATLATDLAHREFGVVLMPNITRLAGVQYVKGLRADMRAVIQWVSDNPSVVGADWVRRIYLMGASAGGFAVASVAAEYPTVKKILLLEPSISPTLFGLFDYDQALGDFFGEVNIVLGDHDGVGPAAGELYRRAFRSASRKRLVTIPDCDHQFKGRKNGQILAKAPLWAFADDTTFPSPEGGLVLY